MLSFLRKKLHKKRDLKGYPIEDEDYSEEGVSDVDDTPDSREKDTKLPSNPIASDHETTKPLVSKSLASGKVKKPTTPLPLQQKSQSDIDNTDLNERFSKLLV